MVDITNRRIYAATTHLFITCVLFWTRFPSVHIALTIDHADSQSTFNRYDNEFKSLIQAGVVFQVVNMLFLFMLHDKVSLSSTFMGVMDVTGAFFTLWMILDGLVFYNYHWIFWFCVMLPCVVNMALTAQFVLQMRWEVIGGFWGGLRMLGAYALRRMTFWEHDHQD
jgi:hypothetical protein